MAKLKVHDVPGDGSCFYWCIWRLCKEEPDVKAMFCIDTETELAGVLGIREFVALALQYQKPLQLMLKDILCMSRDMPDLHLEHQYPFLNEINSDDVIGKVVASIRDTDMMASAFEHHVIASRLANLHLQPIVDIGFVVLMLQTGTNKDAREDTWIRDLTKFLELSKNERVCILINKNNIHYMYATYGGKMVVNRQDLLRDILEYLAEWDSDSDSDSDSVQ